jgi:phosphate transport system ATP-binding protein
LRRRAGAGSAAVRDVSFPVPRGSIVALIGPSGAGKSSLLRCLNRTNDLVPGARVDGDVRYRGIDLYAPEIDAVSVRKRIGMVFQKPNPFPKSIYDNVAFGTRVLGFHGDLDEIVERALRRSALWDEVKDRLAANAFGLSGGQQQRLVIARCLAVVPRRAADGRAGVRAGSDQRRRCSAGGPLPDTFRACPPP